MGAPLLPPGPLAAVPSHAVGRGVGAAAAAAAAAGAAAAAVTVRALPPFPVSPPPNGALLRLVPPAVALRLPRGVVRRCAMCRVLHGACAAAILMAFGPGRPIVAPRIVLAFISNVVGLMAVALGLPAGMRFQLMLHALQVGHEQRNLSAGLRPLGHRSCQGGDIGRDLFPHAAGELGVYFAARLA